MNTPSIDHRLDVRPVKPMHRFRVIMDAYFRLEKGQTLALTVDHDPSCMYYTLLAEQGEHAFSFTYMERGPDAWCVAVTRHTC